MHLVTFYSFKGGVGRTMALVNVGLQLAKKGRRVLLVDMDLEAPGLHTYERLKPTSPAKGVVDFIAEYCKTGQAPSIVDYTYTPLIEDIPGTITVMPTGLQDDEYGVRLNSIDWQALYTERDGFLLFEDLRAQWKKEFAPDYVLIDSRTGHTDIGGICTRQLPDAVAILFFPNDQNLDGLETVVNQIRSDEARGDSPPTLYFVASNVPDLDDEDHILFDRYELFRQRLKYTELTATIRHYDSLALLKQVVFTVDRPNSKLAKEYKSLSQQIISNNYDDRAGVVQTLEEVGRGNASFLGRSSRRMHDALKAIEPLYAGDGEVLYKLAIANRLLGREPVAQRLIVESERLGFETEETLIARAKKDYEAGEVSSARQHLRDSLDKPKERVFSRESAVRIVVEMDPPYLDEFVQLIINDGIEPDDSMSMSSELMQSSAEMGAAEKLLSNALRLVAVENVELRDAVINQLSLCQISRGHFSEALQSMSHHSKNTVEEDLPTLFNSAMARWGESRTAPRDLFLRIVNMHPGQSVITSDTNWLQCFAISYWTIGESSSALDMISRSRTAAERKGPFFSAWRYLTVSRKEFLADLDAIAAVVHTGKGYPEVFRRNWDAAEFRQLD